ncbi:MAG: hypothetical protein RQ754_09840 [Desulfuromonadales bacterium]|nr:hypothetical protein [Desulfuromonadales bacterium]
MKTLGVIADDFTGETDISGCLASNGEPTSQINGIPAGVARADAGQPEVAFMPVGPGCR